METSPIVTSPQSEPDQDNSSLQNPSTNPAEAGTTDETRDEDHETSSIEALNWSEVEEEELAAAQQAEALITQGKSSTGGNGTAATVHPKMENEDEIATNNDSSTNGSSTVLVNDEGNVLSTSLLQSINSTVSDEDPQARKLSVIENWASEVTNAVERGEIEMAEDFPDENGASGDDENDGDENASKTNGVRKRKGNKLSPEMISSMVSSASNGESSVDPLSNVPVLDDGPIWDKGPRIYTFHENRRINQKLTFCLLIAVVLAIGLGLGNLVAHQECEAEYKASQQSQAKPVEKVSVPTATPTPAPHATIHHNYDSSSSLPNNGKTFSEDDDNQGATLRHSDIAPERPQKPQPSQVQKNGDGSSYKEPAIDPKYKVHAETLSRVVHTLDQLSRKIDQFENTTRKLQGVLVIPDEEPTTEAPEPSSIFDEEVRRDDGIFNDDQAMQEEDDEIEIENLIDAIEQTPSYVTMQKTLRRIQENMKYQPRSKLMARKTPRSPEEKQQLDIIIKSVQELKDFERRFVQSERKRLKDEGKLNVDSWRTPEEYTTEEKKAVGTRYKAALEDFHKLLENKVPNPIDTLFGEEDEDLADKVTGDYSWSELQDSLREDGYDVNFDRDFGFHNFDKDFGFDNFAEDKIEDANIHQSAAGGAEADSLLDMEAETTLESNDDLIVLEQIKETLAKADQIMSSEMNPTTDEKMENGKLIAENSEVDSVVPISSDIPKVPTKPKTEKKLKGKSTKAKPQEPGKSTAKPSKSKKSGKTTNGANNSANLNQAQPGNGRNGKREQKQKDLKRQGKTKLKTANGNEGSTGSGNGLNSNTKSKMASKLKKLKNLDSNKVFENIEGKSVEKQRDTRGKDASSSEIRQPDMNNGKEKRSASKKSSSRERSNNGNGNHKNNRNSGQRNPNDYAENKVNDKHGTNYDKSTKLKYEQEDFSTKETQHRQQKQEFNTNYEDRYSGNHNNGKKSKNWQNKERERSRERQRATSWGN